MQVDPLQANKVCYLDPLKLWSIDLLVWFVECKTGSKEERFIYVILIVVIVVAVKKDKVKHVVVAVKKEKLEHVDVVVTVVAVKKKTKHAENVVMSS